MRMEVNAMIETRHDLHACRGGLLRVVADGPQTMGDAVDGERAVHDVVVGGVDNGEDV